MFHMRIFLLLTVAFGASLTSADLLRLVGDQVLAVRPMSQGQAKTLELWRESGLRGQQKVFPDFWSAPSRPGTEIRMHVARRDLLEVKEALNSHGIAFRVETADLGRLIAQESEVNRAAVGVHSKYLRYDEYHATAGALISKCGAQCSKEVIGRSIEGRDIIAYKLGSNSANPTLFMDGGIHAREWVSPATLLYIIDKVISDPEHRSLLDSWNLAIVGLANPDGYEYTHTHSRMWRKNRRPGSVCDGVDLNRNFGFKWGGQGTSSSQCSDVYRGTGPFSEPETQAIRDFVQRNRASIKAFWSVHSYGQYWLHPYGYAFGVNPQNVRNLLDAAKAGAEALRRVNGRRYTVGHSADLLYPAAGGSDDWAISEGVPYAYTIELPDTGRYGFALPASQIASVGEETLAGLKAFLEATA